MGSLALAAIRSGAFSAFLLRRVTLEDVQRVARDLLKDGALAATVLGAVNGLSIPPERLSLG